MYMYSSSNILKQVDIVQWILDYLNPNYPYPDIWTSAHITILSVPLEKIRRSCWSFATGESKTAVRTTFLNATTLFHTVQDLVHDLQRLSSLSKAANTVIRCITA